MAYNLQSLIQLLEQLLHPTDQQKLILDHENKVALQSLLEKAASLKEKIESYPPVIIKRIGTLETQIRDSTFEAEDIIESHIADQILANPESLSLTLSPLNLQHVIDGFESAIGNLIEIGVQTLNSSFHCAPSPTKSSSDTENFVVGIDEDLDQMKERLTRPGMGNTLKVIPIVGMGGIGKTTLARHLYNHPHIISHFDHCAWVTISQEYNVKAILVGLVSSLTRRDANELLECEEDLGVTLHKVLFNRRYLIVLDDIWSTTAWDNIRMFFPDNKTNSCIVITTRDLSVAVFVNPLNSHHQMHLLNELESWNLLRDKAFGDEDCPPSLEWIGRTIAMNCRGLPLAIQVLGGLLSRDPKEENFWKHVADDVSSALAEDDGNEQFSNILSLSYDHLPHHLRPCFLYMAAFPEDYEIPAIRLIWLWVAEGLLQPLDEKTAEEAAEVYLKSLLDRNLILIGKKTLNGEVKSYVIHDMLRDLCLQKAREEKFFYVLNKKFWTCHK